MSVSSSDSFGFDPLHPDLHVWTGMRASDRDRAVSAIDAEIARLTVTKAGMIRHCDRTQLYTEDTHRTVKQWVRAVGNCSGASAGYQVKLSRLFHDLPRIADAYATGEIGADQVRLLVALWSNPRCRDQLAAWQTFLLGCARRFQLDEFEQVCDRWKLAADPDGAHREHRQANAQRHARYDTVGAWFRLIIEGDTITGEMMKQVLDAHTEAEYLTDVAARELEHGANAANHPLPRTNLQRMADAVTVIFMKAATKTETTSREPLVVLFTTPETRTSVTRPLRRRWRRIPNQQ